MFDFEGEVRPDRGIRPKLALWMALALVIGSTLGIGILVAPLVPNPSLNPGAEIAGGLLTLNVTIYRGVSAVILAVVWFLAVLEFCRRLTTSAALRAGDEAAT